MFSTLSPNMDPFTFSQRSFRADLISCPVIDFIPLFNYINTYFFIEIPQAPDECIRVAMSYFINPIYFQYGKETVTAITATST
jgi:hypothetical protein